MPAAELSRIQAQIKAISTQIDQPAVFAHSLTSLLEMYADRTFQPGELTRFKILMPAYRVPALVIHQLEYYLPALADAKPVQALEAADLLWQEKYFEVRLMGIVLLGGLPKEYMQEVIKRMVAWVKPDEEKELVKALLSIGSRRLRQENLPEWFKHIEIWISNENDEVKKLGLQSLNYVIADPEFEDLPKIFNLLEIAVQNPNVTIQKELYTLFSHMTERSPREMSAFLRNILVKSPAEPVLKFIRRCLPLLEETDQKSLKALMERPFQE